ncbi:hypothetical protein C0J52_03263 [Blattella germanica]|nr:hypothetical protein C0J52_03263 [Blattella germanica]
MSYKWDRIFIVFINIILFPRTRCLPFPEHFSNRQEQRSYFPQSAFRPADFEIQDDIVLPEESIYPFVPENLNEAINDPRHPSLNENTHLLTIINPIRNHVSQFNYIKEDGKPEENIYFTDIKPKEVNAKVGNEFKQDEHFFHNTNFPVVNPISFQEKYPPDLVLPGESIYPLENGNPPLAILPPYGYMQVYFPRMPIPEVPLQGNFQVNVNPFTKPPNAMGQFDKVILNQQIPEEISAPRSHPCQCEGNLFHPVLPLSFPCPKNAPCWDNGKVSPFTKIDDKFTSTGNPIEESSTFSAGYSTSGTKMEVVTTPNQTSTSFSPTTGIRSQSTMKATVKLEELTTLSTTEEALHSIDSKSEYTDSTNMPIEEETFHESITESFDTIPQLSSTTSLDSSIELSDYLNRVTIEPSKLFPTSEKVAHEFTVESTPETSSESTHFISESSPENYMTESESTTESVTVDAVIETSVPTSIKFSETTTNSVNVISDLSTYPTSILVNTTMQSSLEGGSETTSTEYEYEYFYMEPA